MNRYLFAALAIAALTAIALFAVSSERYYPLVRVHLPDQSTLTFIDAPWADQQRCLDANRKMAGMVGNNCSQCRMEESCATELAPAWMQALTGHAIDRYVVHSGTLRVAIEAGNLSKDTCVAMAGNIAHDKHLEAVCMPPR